MVLSRRLLWALISIFIFSPAGFSFSLSSGDPGVLRADEQESDLVTFTAHNRYSIETQPKDVPVEVQMAGEPCEQVTCMDIYPKDGKIEGKSVLQMTPSGINSQGQVVGRCILEDSKDPFAFIRESNGNIRIFRTPSSSGRGEFTDISDTGDAVGFYESDSARTKIGFLMNSDRKWVADIKYPENPCPVEKSYLHTQPNGINSEGGIVGNYACTAHPQDSAETLFQGDGFYRAPDGTYYRVQYKDAVRTVAGKISDTGVIVGYYVLENDVWVPFAAMKEDVIHPLPSIQGSAR
jgi:hypothetical protein